MVVPWGKKPVKNGPARSFICQREQPEIPKPDRLLASKLEAATPDNLEIQNAIANRRWAPGLQDEAAGVHERALRRALASTTGILINHNHMIAYNI